MAVAADDRFDLDGVDLEPAHVLDQSVWGDAGVVEEMVVGAVLVQLTRAEKPCSATRLSGAGPTRVAMSSDGPDPSGGRRAGPWSGMKTSIVLSTSVVIVTPSTGSSGMVMPPPFRGNPCSGGRRRPASQDAACFQALPSRPAHHESVAARTPYGRKGSHDRAHGLTKRYGDKLAVDDLTFTVQPGIVTGFLGPNGAGKSTRCA